MKNNEGLSQLSGAGEGGRGLAAPFPSEGGGGSFTETASSLAPRRPESGGQRHFVSTKRRNHSQENLPQFGEEKLGGMTPVCESWAFGVGQRTHHRLAGGLLPLRFNLLSGDQG